jgi:hypothetical protein
LKKGITKKEEKMNTQIEIVKLTVRDLIENRKGIRYDLACQREQTKKWGKEESAIKLWDSMVNRSWPIQPIHIIKTDETLWSLDGSNRIRTIMRLYDGETPLYLNDGTPVKWENLNKDEKEKFLSYELHIYYHPTMTDEEQAEFFARLNGGGSPLTTSQVTRGSWIVKMGNILSDCKNFDFIIKMGLARSLFEGMVLQTTALFSGAKDLMITSVLPAIQSATPAQIESAKNGIVRLNEILSLSGESPEEEKVIKKMMKKSHIPTLIRGIAESKCTDNDKIYNALFKFYEMERDTKSPERKAYDDSLASNSAGSDNVQLRIETIRELIDSNNTHNKTDKKQKDLAQMNAEREALKKQTMTQPPAEQPAEEKSEFDKLLDNAPDPFMEERKAAYTAKHNKMKNKQH